MMARLVVCFVVALLSTALGFSQSASLSGQGINPGQNYVDTPIDSVNTSNGNLVLHIPLVSYKQRGTLPDFRLSLGYNNLSWQLVTYLTYEGISIEECNENPDLFRPPCSYQTWEYTGQGVTVVRDNALINTPSATQSFPDIFDEYSNDPTDFYAYGIGDSTGAAHFLYSAPATSSKGALRTMDGSGILQFSELGWAYDSRGIRHSEGGDWSLGSWAVFLGFGDQWVDPEGNSVTPHLTSNTGPISYWIDSLGRNIPAPNPYGNTEVPQVGCYTYQYPAQNSGTSPYTYCYQQYTVSSNFQQYGVLEGSFQLVMLSSVTLPNGTSYKFSYNSWGELSQIALPEGGTITYGWVSLGTIATTGTVSRVIQSRQLNPGDGSPLQMWNYTIGTNPPGNVVMDPLGNQTVYSGGLSTIETHYQGTYSTGTLLYSVNRCREYQGGADTIYPSAYPYITNPTIPCGTTTTLSDGSVSQESQIFDPPTTVGDFLNQQGDGTALMSIGIPLSVITTDYGAGAPGPVVKTMTTQYEWQGNSSYFNANFLNSPCVVTTYGPGTVPQPSGCALAAVQANQASQTIYGYDENNGSPQGIYGNNTSVSSWLDSSSAAVKTTLVYNSQGMVTDTYDGNLNAGLLGNHIKTAYDATGLFPSSITQSSTSGVNHIDDYSFDGDTGNMKWHTDQNGSAANDPKHTTTYSYDNMRRPISVRYPDGGGSTYCYTDEGGSICSAGSAPYAVHTSTVISSSPTLSSISSSTQFNGFGQPTSSTAPNGAVTKTTYDLDARVYSVSNPYYSTSDPTFGITEFLYDALGRKTVQCQPDNGTSSGSCVPGKSYQSWTYGGKSTIFKDEGGNQWTRTSDALGRLTNVVEPGSLATVYLYDALGNLKTVTQHGVSTDTPRIRSFTYDSLSRLLTSTNPESGTICYGTWSGGAVGSGSCTNGYDPNSNLLAKTDARGIKTNYVYDALNRLYAKSYFNASSQSTGDPSVFMQYDRPATGGSDLNSIGRMTMEWTGTVSSAPSSSSSVTSVPTGALTSTVILSHDAMGRVTSEQQCPVYPCSTAYPFSYSYDLAGDLIQWNNGMPTPGTATSPGLVWTASYDGAARISGVQASTQPWTPSATYPSELVNLSLTGTTPSYDAFGHIVNEQASIYPTNSGSPSLELVNAYDGRGRITSEQALGHAAPSTAATDSFGVIAVTGSEQTQAVSFLGTGTLTISGVETGVTMPITNAASCTGAFVPNPPNPPTTATCYPAGGGEFLLMQISMSSGQETVVAQCGLQFGPYTTAASIASVIEACINNSTSSTGVTATTNGTVTANGATVTATLTTASTSSKYVMAGGFGSGPFSLSSSGLFSYTPLGGPDTGTVQVAISNGSTNVTTAPVVWGASSVPTTLAPALVSAINTAQSQASGGAFVKATLDPNGYMVYLQSVGAGSTDNYPVVVNVADTSNPILTPSFQFDSSSTAGGANAFSGGYAPLYSYSVPSGGYAANSNLMAQSDSVMGDWAFQYDALNRLTLAAPAYNTPAALRNMIGCYGYDAFGNRTLAGITTTDCSGTILQTATYNAKNQVTWTSVNAAAIGFGYDNAGNVTNDGQNEYLYDAEGRLCAVNANYSVAPSFTRYIYNAEGTRVAKGTLTNWPTSCGAPGANGFSLTAEYLLGQGGDQVTELNTTTGKMAWAHSNVSAGAQLGATYDPKGLHFHLTDPLGTRRVQTNPLGAIENSFQSLPFGDGLASNPTALATANDAAEHHFTGKERDAESGLDYFGARYYGSSMGRFMSPDPSKLSVLLTNPQTWNRYSYVYNNPLSLKDENGKWPTSIHNQIIDKAFPNLSPAQRQILKNVSANQDGVMNGGQSKDLSFEHAMRAPGQSVADAQAKFSDFVSTNEAVANNSQIYFSDPDTEMTEINSESLAAFGEALHAIEDSLSPAHAGFQVWDYNPAHVLHHHNAESSINAQQMQNAVNAARNAFNTTYSFFGFTAGSNDNATVTTSQHDIGPCGGTSAPCPK